MSKLYIIPDAIHIEDSLALAEQYDAHFEYNDFYMPDIYGDTARVDALIDLYVKGEQATFELRVVELTMVVTALGCIAFVPPVLTSR
jgi:hypothetical protein